MLDWFDQNPDRAGWVLNLAVLAAIAAVIQAWRREKTAASTSWDWLWTGVTLLLLSAGRWPTWFYAHEFNQDESAFVAGAMTLRHDPVFWRAVDGGTTGPFDFYALFPAGWLHGHDDYFSARLTALVLIGVALLFAHQTIALGFGRLVARACSFPALCFEAMTWERSFLHYSSELAPIALLAIGAYLAVRRIWNQASWLGNLFGGIVLGAVPLAKPQAAPLALAVGLAWLIAEYAEGRKSGKIPWRHIAALLAGALTPIAIAVVVLVSTHQVDHALIPYRAYTAGYVTTGMVNTALLVDMWLLGLVGHTLLNEWLVGSGIVLLVLIPFILRASDRKNQLLLFATVGWAAVSVACILTPGRPFLHYWQLIVIPWTLLLGVGTGLAMQACVQSSPIRALVLGVVLLGAAGPMIYARSGLPMRFLGLEARAESRTLTPVAAILRKLAQPGESLGLWGWMTGYYVESGLRPATRRPHVEAIITNYGSQDYFRASYLADLRQSQPPVFVDAVAPGSFVFVRPEQRHETVFPELAAYISEHYTLVTDFRGNRIYVRNDRLAQLLHQANSR